MNALKRALLAFAAVAVVAPAAAQVGGYEGDQFVSAIRKQDNDAALKLLQDHPTVANARDLNGNTALSAAIENQDYDWTGYLLRLGADPNASIANGDTPLILASRVGFKDAVEWLLGLNANVDAANRMGETALIVAVQRRQVPIVRLLMDAGANPDKTDSAQGYSARDYAKRDNRTPELLRIIESKKPAR